MILSVKVLAACTFVRSRVGILGISVVESMPAHALSLPAHALPRALANFPAERLGNDSFLVEATILLDLSAQTDLA